MRSPAIWAALRYDPHEPGALITVGGSEAIDMCIRTLVQPGDEVIIRSLAYVCYEPITTLSGGVPVPVSCRAEDCVSVCGRTLWLVTSHQAPIMPFPNNPPAQ